MKAEASFGLKVALDSRQTISSQSLADSFDLSASAAIVSLWWFLGEFRG
jgi:hypothetical protein